MQFLLLQYPEENQGHQLVLPEFLDSYLANEGALGQGICRELLNYATKNEE